MDEVRKLAELTAENQASDSEAKPEDTEETSEDSTQVETETEEAETESTEVDYKAELERAQKRLSQAEFTIQKEKERRRSAEEKSEESGEKFSAEEIRKIIQEEQSKWTRNFTEGEAKRLATSLASSEDEQKLILFHYQNTIAPTGNLDQDMRRAKLLANESRYDKDLQEAYRALASKSAKGAGTGAGQKDTPKKAIKLTPQEERIAKAFNLTPEELAKAKEESA